MFRFHEPPGRVKSLVACGLGVALNVFAIGTALAQTHPYPGVGRLATPSEVAAWDIDVRPDFKGLPKGSGSVARGQEVWEAKCASCHGVFGESNEVFSPLVGGTSAKDIPSGRVARLTDPTFPGRTTLMKVSSVSTLWDYINRAMPWNQPKSLTVDEVYAVTAFLLNLGEVLPDDFVLSDQTMAIAQSRLPNRNGVSTQHALWPGDEFKGKRKPDVQGSNCMRSCPVDAQVASFLPDFARNAHGNLYLQNRYVGQQLGADTSKPEGATAIKRELTAAASPIPVPASGTSIDALLQKNNCLACHAAERKLVGPSWKDVAQKHAGKGDYLTGKIRAGGAGVWGTIPMPAQNISENDAKQIASWLAAGAAK